MAVRQMKRIIKTKKAPQPIGPYSQAVEAGNLLFVSGQIPINPKTGEVVSGSISEQTRQVLENIKGILEDSGLSLENVVKTTIFLRNIKDFKEMNEVYKTFFKSDHPARATVQAVPPGDIAVEIDAIAYIEK